MNNEQIHQKFLCYGKNARLYVRKCIALLPVVYEKKIYKEKGFDSIFEYAAKLAGLSKEQVKRTLSLDERFEETPVLKEMLRNGEVSINKLARVASVATPENQEELAAKVKALPQKAIETLVKDEKGIDINELLLELLNKREKEIAEEKEKLSKEAKPTKSTYIKVNIKKVLKKEHGTKCSIPRCNKPAINLHHTRRFALSHTHDPKYLAPLCREHHQIAHAVDEKVREYRQIVHTSDGKMRTASIETFNINAHNKATHFL